MALSLRPISICFSLGILTGVMAAQATQLQKRTPFAISLAKLSLSFDQETHRLRSVRVSYEGSNNYANITPWHDEYVKITRKGREKTVHRESPEWAHYTSGFEAEQLYRVSKALVVTLTQFEKDLQRKRWDKCLYLDAFLPKFLRGYYYLCDAIRNSHDALPRVARIPESAFDVSLNSPKSDKRISKWQQSPEHIIKLRIIVRELVYQLKTWLSKAEKNRKRNPEIFFGTKLKKAYTLFVRIYFNLKPVPRVPSKGEHF